MIKKLTGLMFALLLNAFTAEAGWEITMRYSDSDGIIDYETLKIQDQVLKSSSGEDVFLFNVKSGELIMLNNSNKTYWKGHINQFRQQYQKAMQVFIDQMLENVPPEQKEMYGQMMEGMSEIYSDPDPEKIKAIDIEVERAGATTQIAGYNTTKYVIKINGETVEELWLSEELDLSDDLDISAMADLMNEIRPNIDDEMLYEYTDEYLDLWEQGYPMKTIDAEGEVMEVIKVEEKAFDDSEFEIPEAFRQLTIEEMLQMQMMQGEEQENGDW